MQSLLSLSDDELVALSRRAIAMPQAPAALVNSAIGLWKPQANRPGLASSAAVALGWLQQVIATLTFDSAATPGLALGMRSAASDTRHLLFAAEGRDIDLRISAEGDAFRLAGQVLGPDESGSLSLTPLADHTANASAADTHSTTLDTLGAFQFSGIAAGRYRLALVVGNQQILLPPLDVGQPVA